MTNVQNARRAPDPRPARTRAAILAAVESLGAKGADLNVSAIVSEAGLSRSSFYSQFKDTGDIAVQLVREIEAQIEQADQQTGQRGEHVEATLNSIELLITHFRTRRDLYNAVLGGGANVSAQWAVCEIMADVVAKRIAATAPADVEVTIAAKFIAAGMLASIIEWISSSDPLPVDDFTQQLLGVLPSWVSATTR